MEDVSAGERILLADGAVELLIKAKSNNLLTAKVVAGGVIHSHKGVNFPSSPLRIPAFTEKDQADLALGLEEQVDFVALSFVRHERDLEPFSQIINQQKHKPLLIVKIEKSQAVEHFAAILERVDGVMVARGDLGVEMLFEKVPHIQKKIIGIVRKSGKPVITATQMLLSMTENPRPTRAEATDAANAILDGTDAIMLSEETAIGRFPRESVQVPDRITRETEPNIDGDSFLAEQAPNTLPPTPTAISRSACWLARDLRAAVILAFTSSGGTARLVSRFRPPYPIIALTPNLLTQRQLTLSWGIYPSAIPAFTDSDKLFSVAKSWILNNGMGKKGDRIILIAGIPLGIPGKTNLLKVIRLE
jgi:pyruvate kinase